MQSNQFDCIRPCTPYWEVQLARGPCRRFSTPGNTTPYRASKSTTRGRSRACRVLGASVPVCRVPKILAAVRLVRVLIGPGTPPGRAMGQGRERGQLEHPAGRAAPAARACCTPQAFSSPRTARCAERNRLEVRLGLQDPHHPRRELREGNGALRERDRAAQRIRH